MRQLLQLHPSTHTGKVLHHRHTSYRALFLVFVLAGVFIVFLGSAANAADYVVTATIPAPVPAGAPVITAPPDGTTIPTPAATISGTCPVIDPAIIVALNDDTSFLGSQQCTSDGTFSIPVTLSPGAHHIIASVTTITGDTGESSQAITVTYAAPPATTTPISASRPAGGGKPATSVTQPLLLDITSESPFIVFGPTADAVWNGSISGGTPPYRISIDWGDGTRQAFINRTSDKQSFSHHYTHLKTFRVTLQITDSAGQSITRTIAAISPATFNHPATGSGVITANSPQTMWLYAAYGQFLALTLLFWRYEYLRHHFAPVQVRMQKPIRASKHLKK
jgi:hypothetical protein